MLYFGRHKEILLASRIIVGISYGGILVVVHISVGEYTSPHWRGFFLNLISCVGSLFGSFMGHILSILMHWRNVALIGIIPTVLAAFIPLFWKESPSWLASKGRFQECEIAFEALHIPSKSSKNELKLLINIEKRKQDRLKIKKNTRVSYVRKICSAFKQKYFWNIFFIALAANTYRVANGRILFATFAITILQEITGNSSILYFTICVDGFAIFGAAISCILLKRFKMRSLLFSTGAISICILSLLALFLYIWPENTSLLSWVKVFLLSLYFITVTAGPYPVVETLMTEIFPLELKTFCLTTHATICGILQFLSIKLAPSMFLSIGYHGVFFLHVIITFLCLFYLYFYLPETKSKTLQEIEMTFRKDHHVTDIELDKNETLVLNNENLEN